MAAECANTSTRKAGRSFRRPRNEPALDARLAAVQLRDKELPGRGLLELARARYPDDERS